MTNILEFLPAGWGRHKGGGEWAGPCPGCGGDDRFVVWPEHSSGAVGGKYLCRGCSAEGGDGIQFLRSFMGMSFQDACKELGAEAGAMQSRPRVQAKPKEWEPKEERIPSEAWQKQALAFLAFCREHAESGEGAEYLCKRGITPETAQRFNIGWNPADTYVSPEVWGIEPWFNSKGNLGKLYFPAGLVLPTFRKSGPVAVKVRRKDWFKGDKWPKYFALKGGGDGCLVLGKLGLPVVVVESELDAYLLAQDAAGLCSLVALGSAANHPDVKTAEFIRQAPAILYALDFDAAGMKPYAWWKDHFPALRVWPPVVGKDLGDMVENNISLAVWVAAALEDKKPLPAWEEICPSYYHGCFSCEYMNPDDLTFCRKFSRNGEVLQ